MLSAEVSTPDRTAEEEADKTEEPVKRIAYESIIGTARAAIAAMTNHRGIRTRPSTLSIGQGRSAN